MDTGSSASPADGRPLCVACRSPIGPGASLCPVCRSYQCAWKNQLQYLGGIVALLAAIVAVVVWAVSNAPAARRAVWPRTSVHLIAAHSELWLDDANARSLVVIANDGDTEVFVSHVRFEMTLQSTPVSKDIAVMELVAPGRFLRSAEVPSNAPRPPKPPLLLPFRGIADNEWLDSLRRAVADRNRVCFQSSYYYKHGKAFRELQDVAGPALRTFDGRGYVTYHTIVRPAEQHSWSFPAVGVVYRVRHDCQ